MLSVVPIKSSSISAGYYLKQDGNYYIDDKKQSDLYEWFGKGAKALGLNGAVDLKDHEKIYSGQLPNGEIIGRKMPDGSIKGRPGYDLTFSMNKDISLIICCSKDKALSDYFLNAHINAVKTVLTEVEKKVQARITENNITTYQTTKNMVASLCTHFSSRAGDPEVHTHALIANATERLDGKWRALATDMSRKNGFFEMIRDNAVYFGMLYQNEMAYATKQMGFEVERVHKNGMFQIKGFSGDMRDFFSKRRKQIEDIIKTMNPSVQKNKKIFDQVAQHSKAGKINMGMESFFEKAKNDMQTYLDRSIEKREFDTIINACREKTIDQKIFDASDKDSAREAIIDAISHESQFSVTLDANKIMNKAIIFNLGKLTHQDLLSALNHMVNIKLLLPLEDGKYTSKALLDREKDILSLANQGAASRLTVIREPSALQDKQLMLSDLIAEHEKNHKKVKILSINKSMSSQHNDYARKNDISIWQRLKEIGKSDLAHGINSFLHSYESDLKMPLNNLFTKKGKEVFIVDDAQRLSLDTMQKLLTLTQKCESNIIFLKHTEGMKNVLSGNPLEIIEKCEISKIDARHLRAPKASVIKNDNLKISITQVKNNTLDKNHTQEVRQGELAKTVVKQYGNDLSQTLVLSQSKAAAQKLNFAIRDELISNSKVGVEQKYITVTEPVFLSREEQKHAKFYPNDAFIKTYIGRRQFNISKIVRHDLEENKIIVENEKLKRSIITPKSIIELMKKNETQLYTEKRIGIALGDQFRLIQANKQASALHLKMGQSYVVIDLKEKKITLESNNKNEKTLSIKVDQLNGLPLSYDYARSIHEPLDKTKKNQILCDLPNHAINSNTITELARHTDSLHIITDNKEKAEKKIHSDLLKQNALDQKITDIQKEKTPARAALDYAVSVVGSREAAFELKPLIEKALSYKLASVKIDDLRSEIKAMLSEGVLHSRTNQYGDIVFATQEAIELENKIITQIKEGKNQVSALLPAADAKAYLNNTTLTQGQKNACELISTTTDRFVMIQGYAGTGKSTMLQTLIGDRTLENIQALLPHVEVMALAPTHKAVLELQNKGIKSQTLKSFLVDFSDKDDFALKNKLIFVDES